MHLLALEASTTSAKAMLFDSSSGNYAVRIKPYPKADGTELLLTAETVFDCMTAVGRELAGGLEIEQIALVNA